MPESIVACHSKHNAEVSVIVARWQRLLRLGKKRLPDLSGSPVLTEKTAFFQPSPPKDRAGRCTGKLSSAYAYLDMNRWISGILADSRVLRWCFHQISSPTRHHLFFSDRFSPICFSYPINPFKQRKTYFSSTAFEGITSFDSSTQRNRLYGVNIATEGTVQYHQGYIIALKNTVLSLCSLVMLSGCSRRSSSSVPPVFSVHRSSLPCLNRWLLPAKKNRLVLPFFSNWQGLLEKRIVFYFAVNDDLYSTVGEKYQGCSRYCTIIFRNLCNQVPMEKHWGKNRFQS